jgi:teichuronic acid biosynthesis glycosyltransferase TuaG
VAKPVVSIITPAFNAEGFIRDTIESVQNQSLREWEMIIADDGSTDSTAEIVAEFMADDPRIKIIKLPGNLGPALARNAALDQCEGRFVAFLDSDDTWLPHKLEYQIDFMLKRSAAFSFGQYRRVTEDGEKLGRIIDVPELVTYHQLLKHNVIATLTAVIDTEKTGPVRMTNEGYDDFILWLEILRRGFVAHGIKKDLARYRVVAGSVSRKKLRAARWVWNIYREVEKLSLAQASWNFGNYVYRVSKKHSQF